MNTTLDPKPTDREREMLAEWVGRLSVVQLPNGYLSIGKETMFDYAEELLTEFRARYGVTGAEVEAIRLPKMKSSVQENEWHFDFDLLKHIRRHACGIEPGISEEAVDAVLSVFYRIYGVNNQSKNQTTEPAPIREENITLKEVCAIWEKSEYSGDKITMYSDVSGNIFNPFGKMIHEFNNLPELLAILKGGKSE